MTKDPSICDSYLDNIQNYASIHNKNKQGQTAHKTRLEREKEDKKKGFHFKISAHNGRFFLKRSQKYSNLGEKTT